MTKAASEAASSPYLSDESLRKYAERGAYAMRTMAAEILRLRQDVALWKKLTEEALTSVMHAHEALEAAGIPKMLLEKRVAKLVEHRDELRLERDATLVAGQEWERQAKATPDVASRERCIDLLTKALGKTPATVSEGIELLTIDLAETRVDRDIKVENLTRERDVARSELLARTLELGSRTAAIEVAHDALDDAGVTRDGTGPDTLPLLLSERVDRLTKQRDDLRFERDAWRREAGYAPRPAANAAKSDGDDSSELSQLRQALGLLSTLAPSLVMDTADPLGMAKRIEAMVRGQVARAERKRDAAVADVGEYDKIREALQATCKVHGKRGEESFVSFVERLAQERDRMRFERDMAMRGGSKSSPMPEVRDEPLAGTGGGVQMPGGAMMQRRFPDDPCPYDLGGRAKAAEAKLAEVQDRLVTIAGRRDQWRKRAEKAEADCLVARKVCGAIAGVTKLIEGAARKVAPKQPGETSGEAPPACGVAQKAAEAP
jgi:hypothetical protein